MTKNLKIAVAFSLAMLLGASLFTSTEVTSKNDQLVNNRFINFLLGYTGWKAGTPP